MITAQGEQLTIYEIEEFYKRVAGDVKDKEMVELELSGVKKIDLSLIQLLLSLKKSKKLSLKLSDDAQKIVSEFGISLKDFENG